MIGRQTLAYAAILLVAALSRLAIEFLPFDYVSAGQQAIWSWRFFAIFVVCYAASIALAARAKLPGPGDTLVRARIRLGLPAAVGITVALLTIASDIVAPVAVARGLVTVHVQGVAAAPFYAYGAIVLTTVFHFLPVAFMAWLARRLSGVSRTVLIGIGIALAGLSEDTNYFLRHASAVDIEWARHALSVAANSAEAFFIYRFGLLAGIAQRASTYLVWHIFWPAW